MSKGPGTGRSLGSIHSPDRRLVLRRLGLGIQILSELAPLRLVKHLFALLSLALRRSYLTFCDRKAAHKALTPKVHLPAHLSALIWDVLSQFGLVFQLKVALESPRVTLGKLLATLRTIYL